MMPEDVQQMLAQIPAGWCFGESSFSFGTHRVMLARTCAPKSTQLKGWTIDTVGALGLTLESALDGACKLARQMDEPA